ncbi:hypothetical protein H0H93_014685, partial [Arthromyces matolae]
MAEIKAAIDEEHDARKGLGWKEAFFGKGNFIRFVIAFVFFLLQQWAGPNSINYYAPQIFAAVNSFSDSLTILHITHFQSRSSGIQVKRTPYWRVEST